MPIEYRIRGDVVYVAGTGVVTAADLADHLDSLRRDPAYRSPMKKIVDYRSGRVLEVSTEEIQRIARLKLRLKEAFEGERCAFLVNADMDFGLSRMHGALVEEHLDSAVFREIPPALEWLGVDPGTFDALANPHDESGSEKT